jgi:ABC-2 type transport system permease protein
MVMYMATTGFLFLSALNSHARENVSAETLFFVSLFFGLPVLVTVISMRLFAEEKRMGTLETLMTLPISETQVVLGKAAGAVTFLFLVTLPPMADLFVVAALSPSIGVPDAACLAGGYLGVLLIGAFSTSIGMFVSMLTRNQIVAAICCFCAIVVPLFLKPLVSLLPVAGGWRAAEFVSVETHLMELSRGLLDTRTLVLYASATAVVLFAAVRVLEVRRWK